MTDSPIDVAGAISETVTRLFLEKFGKGPMHVETFVQGDVATTLMRDVLTVAERAMISDGHQETVLTARMLWQHATDQMFKAAVGEATGRQVLSVISGVDLAEEMASEVFVFAQA
jgi:uncharacterized protein YbcI